MMDDVNAADQPLTFDPDVVDFVLELGPVICLTVEECRATLSTVGTNKITPAAVARIMNGMLKASTTSDGRGVGGGWTDDLKPTDTDDSVPWNGKVFVEAVLDLVPTFVWKEVFHQLDFPGLSLTSPSAFRSLVEALRYGLTLQGQTRPDQFPVEAFYRTWNNTEAQMSFVRHGLNPANYDLFCFADFPFHSASVDILKNAGDKGHDSKEVVTWKSLELVEVLLSLSDAGHYTTISECFQYPVTHCPEILIISLIQLSTPLNPLRQELLATLFPLFLNTHVSSGAVLNFAWQQSGTNSIRPVLMMAMAEWYLQSDCDQAKLSRILDIAQDLKALSLLLNANSTPFVIDLAILASRREFLKLDKWLGDKVREFGEPFLLALVNALKRRVPQLMGREDPGGIKGHLPPEVMSTIINSLHQAIGKTTNQDLTDTIMTIGNNYTRILTKQRQPAQQPIPSAQSGLGNILRSHRSLEPSFNVSSPPPPPPNLNPFGNDPLTSLGSTLAGLNLAGVGSFGLSGLNSVSPGSPSRLLGHNVTHSSPQQNSAFVGLQGPLGPPNRNSTPPIGPMGNPLMSMLSGRFTSNQSSPSTSSSQPSTPESRRSNNNQSEGSGNSLFIGGQNYMEIQGEISKEAEDEANGYFHRIYSKPPDPSMSIDEVLELLKRFKDSSIRREREVFACMLRNLFEEYKFFPQYPEKELHTTAQLFGGIIEHGLVSSFVQLGLALRFVVDALKKQIGSKMYYFGIAALDRFKLKLKDYPQYCQHLKSIPHFYDFPSTLADFVEFGANQREPPSQQTGQRSRPGAASLPPAQGTQSNNNPAQPISLPSAASAPGQGKPIGSVSASSLSSVTTAQSVVPQSSLSNSVGHKGPSITGRPSIANATNITTLLVATEKDEKITPPPENIQDKTAFIFNNLNQMNLTDKCKELKDLLASDHWLWMSQYLVMKRASIELNFHTLYSNLLDTLKVRELSTAVVKETHRNIQILLRADKSASNFSDRSLLKNLGHWLGMITVMKNKPIVMDDLDIKSLIVEAYRKGLQDLLYVVPFAAKIMESCARSTVFKPPCPWTMAILSVLAELHKEPEMKLNLKFEIEVLCKALTIEIADIVPATILKSEEAFQVRVRQLSYVQTTQAHPQRMQAEPEKHRIALGMLESQGHQQQQQQAKPEPQQRITPEGFAPLATPPPQNNVQAQQQNSIQHGIGGPVVSGLATISNPGIALEPKFSFMEVDTSNLSALLVHTTVNNQIPLLQAHGHLRAFVKPAIEKGINDLILPVVDRSVKYTINACESIIKKDFAMDPEENRMRTGAQLMMRHLAAGMAMITSRDHIFITISTNLRAAFLGAIRGSANNQQIKDMVEQAVSVIAQENMELACVFIQKTAVEKALQEIEKRLAPEYEVRKQAKMEGRRYCDPAMITYQMDRIPEPIRVKPSREGGNQLGVYEEFSRNVPGFLPMLDGEMVFANAKFNNRPHEPTQHMILGSQQHLVPNSNQQTLPGANDDILNIYDKLIGQMDNYLQDLNLYSSPLSNQLSAGIRTLGDLIVTGKNTRSVVAAITLLQKAVEGLLEGLSSYPTDPEIIRFRDAHLLVLKALQDPRAFGEGWVNRQVTKTLIETRSDWKFNVEAVDTLIRSNLVNMLQFDAYLANALEKGNNLAAMNFAIPLVRMYCVDERFSVVVNEGDFFHTADILCRCATMNRNHPEGLLSLVEALRGNTNTQQQPPQGQQSQVPVEPPPSFPPTDRTPPMAPMLSTHLHSGMDQFRQNDDPSGLVEKSELLLREWIRLFVTAGTPKDSSKPFASFINELNLSGILKSDDVITRFFRISVQCCVNQVYQGLQAGNFAFVRGKIYQTTDALVRLVALLIKHIGDNGNPGPKVNLLNKFLGIVAGLLIQDHEMQKSDFQQLPFHRMFLMLFYDMIAPDPVFESIAMQTLIGFSNTMHILNPMKVPGFSYAWLEIVGNRMFIARMLALAADQKCWAMYCQLLLDLFKFLQPFMRNADMPTAVQTLYRGTLRVLLVILHDFPDFLCDYSYQFLDAIPPNCIQMRNLVLSAFPRNMRLPDPFTANLKFEMLADTSVPPRILSNVSGMIAPPGFKKDIDSYLKTRAPVTFLSELRPNLQVQPFNEPGDRYNIPLINALVLYVGSQHIAVIRGRGQTPSLSTVAHTSHMDIFQNLAVDLDTEGRYLFLNALANQLRFPSSHTHYFSLIILYLFAQSNTEVVQEQITRVLLERLVVNRPHPWGLLVTFIELIKNPAYKFWTHEFVHCAPEVEKLFESVARSCMVTKTPAMTSPPQQQSGQSQMGNQPMSGLHLGTTTNGPSVLNFNTSSTDSSLIEPE